MNYGNQEPNFFSPHEDVSVNEKTDEVHEVIDSLFVEATDICVDNLIAVIFSERRN